MIKKTLTTALVLFTLLAPATAITIQDITISPVQANESTQVDVFAEVDGDGKETVSVKLDVWENDTQIVDFVDMNQTTGTLTGVSDWDKLDAFTTTSGEADYEIRVTASDKNNDIDQQYFRFSVNNTVTITDDVEIKEEKSFVDDILEAFTETFGLNKGIFNKKPTDLSLGQIGSIVILISIIIKFS